jgi:hypothetical protein
MIFVRKLQQSSLHDGIGQPDFKIMADLLVVLDAWSLHLACKGSVLNETSDDQGHRTPKCKTSKLQALDSPNDMVNCSAEIDHAVGHTLAIFEHGGLSLERDIEPHWDAHR